MSRARLLGAVGLVAGVGGPLLAYQQYQSRRAINRLVVPTDFHLNQQPQISDLFARLGDQKDVAFERLKGMKLVLFQFATCPFCSKVRVFLDCCGVPYSIVEVDPFSKWEIRDHPYQKVPQVQVGDQVMLVDSREIISILSGVVGLSTDPSVDRWRMWSSEVLARYVVLRMNSGISDAVANYQYIQSLDIPWSLKLKYMSAGTAMFLLAHKLVIGNLRKQGCKGENIKAELEDELRRWMQEGVGNSPFQGGDRPSIADTDVFGILQSVKGHRIYNDLRDRSVVGPWMVRMEEAVETGQQRRHR